MRQPRSAMRQLVWRPLGQPTAHRTTTRCSARRRRARRRRSARPPRTTPQVRTHPAPAQLPPSASADAARTHPSPLSHPSGVAGGWREHEQDFKWLPLLRLRLSPMNGLHKRCTTPFRRQSSWRRLISHPRFDFGPSGATSRPEIMARTCERVIYAVNVPRVAP